MQSSREIKIGAILSYVIIVVNMLIGVLYTPILTAKLGQTEYGLYSLVTSVISYLTILDFGFGNAIIIYTTRYRNKNEKDKEQKLHGMFLIIYTIIGIIAGIIGAFLWLNVDKLFGNTMTADELSKAKILMGILTLNLVLTFPLSVFSSIITSYEKFVFSKVLNLVRIILNPIVMIILLNFGFKSIALVILNTVLNLGTLILNYIYCKTKLKIKLKLGKIDFKLLREIMAYSVWIFLNSIMDKINWSLDQFVLGIYSGSVAVAIYSVASQLNQMYVNFSTAISGVLLPRVTKMENDNAPDEEFTDIFIKTGRIQYIVMALIMSGFVLYGKEFINIMWVGSEYSESYIIACILMLPSTIPLIQNVGLNILQAKNKYKFRVIVLMVFAVVNVCISIILSKKYGGIGAALGTAISTILGQVVFINVFYQKKVGINMIEFWKNILKMSIPMIFVIILAVILKTIVPINSVIVLVTQIVLYTLIYCLIIYKFAINEYEKQLILKPINKIIRRKQNA
mgnify:FL=1